MYGGLGCYIIFGVWIDSCHYRVVSVTRRTPSEIHSTCLIAPNLQIMSHNREIFQIGAELIIPNPIIQMHALEASHSCCPQESCTHSGREWENSRIIQAGTSYFRLKTTPGSPPSSAISRVHPCFWHCDLHVRSPQCLLCQFPPFLKHGWELPCADLMRR